MSYVVIKMCYELQLCCVSFINLLQYRTHWSCVCLTAKHLHINSNAFANRCDFVRAHIYTTIFMQYFDTFPLNVSVTLALVIEKSVCVHAWAMGIRAKRHTYSQLLL